MKHRASPPIPQDKASLNDELVNPELAIYEAVMERILEDPNLEAAFFGIPEQELKKSE